MFSFSLFEINTSNCFFGLVRDSEQFQYVKADIPSFFQLSKCDAKKSPGNIREEAAQGVSITI